MSKTKWTFVHTLTGERKVERLDGSVKQYSYRSAMVGEVFMVLPREACLDLEQRLAKEAKAPADNHTVYQVTYGRHDQKVTYIWFTDLKVYFGFSIREERW